jgi:hypothetical protein
MHPARDTPRPITKLRLLYTAPPVVIVPPPSPTHADPTPLRLHLPGGMVPKRELPVHFVKAEWTDPLTTERDSYSPICKASPASRHRRGALDKCANHEPTPEMWKAFGGVQPRTSRCPLELNGIKRATSRDWRRSPHPGLLRARTILLSLVQGTGRRPRTLHQPFLHVMLTWKHSSFTTSTLCLSILLPRRRSKNSSLFDDRRWRRQWNIHTHRGLQPEVA